MASPGTNSSVTCRSFKPITWSHKDTAETVKQVIGYNAAWKSLCQKSG